jgi:tetratricopeptide (TPR) repeat protein
MPVTRHNVSGSILLGFSVNNFSVLPICYCRLIGRCHFLMGDLDKALESAQQSLSIEHNSSITQFLLFEIYLQQNKEREVLETLNKLVQCNDKNIQALLEICAQKAFEHGKKLTAIKALEGLLNLFKPDQPGHLAVIIRTLIKLSMQHFEKEDEGHELQQRVASYVKVALDKLKEFGVEQLFNNTSEEIKWFLDTCWNFGLETAKNEEFDLCYDFFSAFITLSKCLPQAIDTLQIQQYAMLLSISAKLSSEMKSRNKERLLDLLQQVDECKQISKIVSIQQQQQKSLQMEVDNNNNNIPTKQDESSTRHETELSCAAILLVLEFAIHAFLGENSTELQRIAENSKNINDATFNPAIYEIMADFALQASATNVDVAISSLQKCFEIYANRQNYEQCGRLLRKLINRCRERERAYYYFERALSLLKNVHNMTYSLPTIEIKWLTTTAYNYGVYYWRLNRFVTAEKWMSLSISLMNYLVPQEKSSFESEIMSSYSAVLKKLSKDKVAQSGDNMEL